MLARNGPGSARRWRAVVGGPPTTRPRGWRVARNTFDAALIASRLCFAAGRREGHAGRVRSPDLI
jgi:hypothetical protein